MHFRSVPHLPFGHGGEALPNVLRFGLDPESLTLDLTGIGARAHTLVPLELTARIDPPELPAYGRLPLDVLNGDPALSIRGDEAVTALLFGLGGDAEYAVASIWVGKPESVSWLDAAALLSSAEAAGAR